MTIRPIAQAALPFAVLFAVACGSSPPGPSSTAEAVPTTPPPGEPSSPLANIGATAVEPAPATSPGLPSDASNASPGNEGGLPKAASVAPTVLLSEHQIARVTELANSAEVEQGRLAESKAKNPAVKKFAAMMVKHHSEAKTEQAQLYQQLKLTPAQSQQATLLKDDADKTLGALRAVDGPAFDTAYVNAQVDAHQKVLDSIVNDLLPAAKAEKLVSVLNTMKLTVERHLEEAKTLQQKLAP